MKCEIEWCKKERSCFNYCSEHHNVVCMEGDSYIPAIRPKKRASDRAKSAVKKSSSVAPRKSTRRGM